MADSRAQTRRTTQSTQPTTGRAARRAEPLPIPPGPHRRAGRRRGLSRSMRKFESAIGRMEIPQRMPSGKQVWSNLRGGTWPMSKIASALLLAAVITVLINMHTHERWFVYADAVRFTQATYLEAPELYTHLQVDGWNIFWLQPDLVRDQLLHHPAVTDAQVRLALPAALEIGVTERPPIALWITNNGVYRVADNGIVLSAPLTQEEAVASPAAMALPQIVDPLQEAQRPGITNAAMIDENILAGALELMSMLPDLDNRVRYNRDVGFNFPLPDGEGWVYWGDGLHPDEKRTNLAAARQYMTENAIENRIVDVRFINRPYLR